MPTGSWITAMAAAGVCSAGAILLIRESPKFAAGVPPMIAVGAYLLLGGIAVLAIGSFSITKTIIWPNPLGFAGIAVIGFLLAALEVFFVLAARWNMRLPDGMIVYNVISLALVSIIGTVVYREQINPIRVMGLLSGGISLFCFFGATR